MNDQATMKKAWSCAKTLLGHSAAPTPTAVKIGDTVVMDPQTIAKTYAELHRHKIMTLRSEAPMTPTTEPATRLMNWLSNTHPHISTFKFKKINYLQLLGNLRRLKPGKTPQSDTIDGATIKAISGIMSDALIHIINLSLTQGRFSDGWKQQIMSPRHKKGNMEDLNNYRPVCTIVEVGKLTEMAAHDQIMDHFVSNSQFSGDHHGSVPYHDTTTALININNFTTTAAEAKQITATVLLDQ